MPTFNYKCVLITYNPNNISKIELHMHRVSSLGSACIIQVSSTDFTKKSSIINCIIYIYIYMYTYTYIHTYIHIYISQSIYSIIIAASSIGSDEWSNLSHLFNHI